MDKPNLTVVAGCNRLCKSSFATTQTPDYYDYDKIYLNFYQKEMDSNKRDFVANNKCRLLPEERVQQARIQTSLTGRASTQQQAEFCILQF
ncbi:MAG: hypothetical protein R8N23_04560 [Reichenbachiella sp.]|uniref:hypothetical protein n=1 Tax=Reichenbachiella sp. TaxID=2184521 RepID=UPI002966269E|nr:hypothetical protein [Reichenbachiella sp.]MDW3209114.1 hypothetical protein [Reichenbachiella sp.]